MRATLTRIGPGRKAQPPVGQAIPANPACVTTPLELSAGVTHCWVMRRITLVITIVALVAAAGLIALQLNLFGIANGPGGLSGKIKSAGTALVGGPFSLTDHTGKRFTEKNLEGQYSLIYFGYTYCPDVCPTELQVMSAALDEMGEEAGKVRPIFVSVDPDRDTRDVIAEYVSNFHPRMVGLTGTAEEIATVATAYRVFYKKVPQADKDAEYLMDHSSITYLMGPDGKFISHFAYATKPAKFVEGLRKALAQSN